MNADQKETDFPDTPEGRAQLWKLEMDAAKAPIEKWHQRGDKIVARFHDERTSGSADERRWNIFTSNTQTRRAMLYGKTPQVSVERRFADAQDDVARVAAEMQKRLANADIERDSDTCALALQHALDDLQLAGMGSVRLRYVAEFKTQEVEARVDATGAVLADGYTQQSKSSEDVEVDYVYWKDQLWSEARVFHEVRWWAFRAEMSQRAVVERFADALARSRMSEVERINEHGQPTALSEEQRALGEKLARAIPLNAKTATEDGRKVTPWARAEVWEIWSKEDRRVEWWVDGYPRILDSKDDPLGLAGFWPFPRPMMANTVPGKFIPTPDFTLAQDLYNELDSVCTRISLLERAVRVAGVYDKSNTAVQRLIGETGENELIPVENWAMLAEKGGLKGVVDWFPLDQVVAALAVMRQTRAELVDAIYQQTGMSDIMRGQQVENGTPGEAAIKARFGSVRMQAMQDEFARFASDAQRLKAEIISKHFDAGTIIERSNILQTPDASLAEQAAAFIQSRFSHHRVCVKPEAISLTDFAALKQEKTEVLTAISTFLTATAPLVQQMPESLPYLLQMLQWFVAGVRGASGIEGVLDQAIAKAQQAAAQATAQPKPAAPSDPKLLAQQMKGQQDLAKVQAELEADLTRTQAEVAADERREQAQAEWGTREAMARRALTPPRAAPVRPMNGGTE